MYEHLLFETNGQIATVSINNPKSLNALNSATLAELNQCLSEIEVRKDIRVVIVTGSGAKAFVAGADISEMVNATPAEGRAMALLAKEAFFRLEKMPQVTIAAVNGYALGGGCELAMACDFRIASSKAKFGQPEVGLGITPGFGGTQRLSKLVGKGMAKMLILTADTINAEEALRIGLVEKVTEPEQLMSVCEEIAAKIASKAPIAVAMSKTCINKGYHLDLFSGSALEAEAFGGCFGTEDQKEGMKAFLEKRPAEFKNK